MTPEEAKALIGAGAAADAAVLEQSGPAIAANDPSYGERELVDELQEHGRGGASLVALEEENRALLTMALEFTKPMLPFLPQIYTPEVITNISKAGAAVEHKYGFSLTQLFGKYKEEGMLAIAIVPPTVQAIMVTRAWMAKQKAEAEKTSSSSPAADAAPAAS